MKASPKQLDALRELLNIGIGRAAGILNEVLSAHIKLRMPEVEILSAEEFESKIDQIGDGVTAAVRLGFHGPFKGTASLVFSQDSANKLVNILTGKRADDKDFDDVKRSALSEIGNMVINGVMGSISNMLDAQLNYSIPSYVEQEQAIRSVLRESATGQVILLGHAQFYVTEHLIRGEVLLVFEIGSFQGFIDALDATIPETRPVVG
ncbi:MAG: chemotaxis protein CheC [Acidobacteria bacterium]|nr:MAG: chemotaxis protein CheC [Acidobacteriota bacterium]